MCYLRLPLLGIAALAAGCSGTPAGAPPWQASPLAGLYRLRAFEARRVSSHDRAGGNADFLANLEPGATARIADLPGPGIIRHLWFTIDAEDLYLRKIVLRIWWDGEAEPSVQSPIGDFFCLGHGDHADLLALPIAVSSNGRALNAYFPMPFRERARIEVTNEAFEPVRALYYAIDYQALDDPGALGPDAAYFHAQYRQAYPCEPGVDYVILQAQGRGHYIGCNLSVEQNAPGWWGEGDDRITVDGALLPRIQGTGTEDAFCDAWGMRVNARSLYYGCSIQTGSPSPGFRKGDRATVYRFHIEDPIPFRTSIRVAIEHGHANRRGDNDSSVAYWYQVEPHAPFPPLPPVEERLPADARGDREYGRTKAALRRARAAGRLGDGIRALEAFTEHFPDYRRAPVALLKLAGLEREVGAGEDALAAFRAMAHRYAGTIYGRLGRNELLLAEGGVEALVKAQADLPLTERKRVLRAGRGPAGAPGASAAAPAEGFLLCGEVRRAPLATRVRVRVDAGGLHVRVRVEEPLLFALRARVEEHDGPVWEDDAIELFFDPDRDYFDYAQLVVNAKGILWDGLGDENEFGRAGLWNPEVEVETTRGEGSWGIDLTIPFGEGNLPRPAPGDVWGWNVRRFRRAAGREELWTWSYLAPDGMHQPQRFGYLVFP